MTPSRFVRLFAALLAMALLAASCGDDSSGGDGGDASGSTTTAVSEGEGGDEAAAAPFENPFADYTSDVYGEDDVWLCRPDIADDICDEDQTATEVAPDGSQTEVPFTAVTDAPYDCFYVYPTLDYAAEAGNHPFEVENALETITTQVQAARFSSLCNLYVPRYRQATIGSYQAAQGADIFDTEPFQVAYDDVVDSFKFYMATWNDDRPFVLLGHSQGSHHLIRMIQEEFDGDANLTGQLISALLVGPTGRLRVPPGEAVGGTFDAIPLCGSADETGCAIGFDSFAAEEPPTRGEVDDEGNVPACVNPTQLVDGDDRLEASYFVRIAPGVTPFTEVIEDYYTATCTETPDGIPYLEIAAAPADGDTRDLTDIESRVADAESLHTVDYNFSLGDLLSIVETQAAAHSAG